MNVLLLANMGPSKQKPVSGLFIQNQYLALKSLNNPECKIDYFYLNQNKRTTIKRLLKYPIFFLRFFKKYILAKKKLDIIHVHFYYPCIWFAIFYRLLRNPKTKIVVTFHGSDIYKYQKPSLFYRTASYFIDHAIFVSEQLKQCFYRKLPSSEVLSAGVLDIFYQPSQQTNNKCYDLIFVGHLDHNKGFQFLLDGLAKISKPLTIAVVSPEPNYNFYNQAQNQQHYYQWFYNQNPQALSALYARSKFLINCSINESFGLVMAEALAMGTPVIATQTDGSKAQIVNGENGFLVSNYKVEALVSLLEKVLYLSNEEYDTISCAAKKSVTKYKLTYISQKIYSVYKKLSQI